MRVSYFGLAIPAWLPRSFENQSPQGQAHWLELRLSQDEVWRFARAHLRSVPPGSETHLCLDFITHTIEIVCHDPGPSPGEFLTAPQLFQAIQGGDITTIIVKGSGSNSRPAKTAEVQAIGIPKAKPEYGTSGL